MAQTATRPALLNERQAADWLGLSVRWMQQRRVTGDGPRYVKISARAVRYRVEDLAEFAEGRLRSSTSEPDRAA